jgi:hypothetical protein
MVTIRRKLGGLLFGLFYGSLVIGFGTGLAYVARITGNEKLSFDQRPSLELAVLWLSVVLTGFLSGYVGRSWIIGGVASVIGTTLMVAVVPEVVSVGSEAHFSNPHGSFAVSAYAVAAFFALQAARLPTSPLDLDFGRVFGVSWKHWLWLWLPWQYFIANVIWLSTPRFVLLNSKPSLITGATDLVASIVGVCAVGYSGLRAVRSLRADAPLTRGQSAARFALWFFVVPVLVNLWRLMIPKLDTTLGVFGWAVWAIVAILALSWAYGIRVYTKKGQSIPIATAVQTLFLWIIAVVFLFVGYSKLHILWVAPICFLASFYLTLARRVPILTPLVIWFTGLFVEIVLLGLKRPNTGFLGDNKTYTVTYEQAISTPPRTAPEISPSAAYRVAEKGGALDGLKDKIFLIELQHQAGTISEEDYARERARIKAILHQLFHD